MKIFLCLISFILFIYLTTSTQPNFPSQISFSYNDDQVFYAIDQINQRAYKTVHFGTNQQETTFAFKHIPFALPDSPESKYYVQLLIDSPPFRCIYGTYWEHGGCTFNSFPSDWAINRTSFEIKEYLQFSYTMIHSNDSSKNEDYWYANINCKVDSGETYPCQEIFFQKNTDIPLRLTEVVRRESNVRQEVTYYTNVSIGNAIDKYFDSIPKNWSFACRDIMLGILINPQITEIPLNKHVQIQIWLSTPPHRINGSDTVTIQWTAPSCSDCFTWSPKQLSFNIENFEEKQTLTITRVKNTSSQTEIYPIFNGGGFHLVNPELYPIYIQ
jgi:hypothetical protein